MVDESEFSTRKAHNDSILDMRQKLAIALLVPLLSVVSYAFISLWRNITEGDALQQKVNEHCLAVEQFLSDVSHLDDIESILGRTKKRIADLVDENISVQMHLTTDELDTRRDTIAQHQYRLVDDEGVLERYADANVYPFMSKEAASVRRLLQSENRAWSDLKAFIEMQADTNIGDTEKTTAFHTYQNSLSMIYRQASAVQGVSEAFHDSFQREQKEKLQQAESLAIERRGNRRSVFFHLVLFVVGLFGVLFCFLEALGLQLQRRRSRIIVS